MQDTLQDQPHFSANLCSGHWNRSHSLILNQFCFSYSTVKPLVSYTLLASHMLPLKRAARCAPYFSLCCYYLLFGWPLPKKKKTLPENLVSLWCWKETLRDRTPNDWDYTCIIPQVYFFAFFKFPLKFEDKMGNSIKHN